MRSKATSDDPWAAARRHLARVDPVLAKIMSAFGPCTIAANSELKPFEYLTSAIVHQQLNGTAAKTILRRYLALFGDAERYPTPEQLLASDTAHLRRAGLSQGKTAALRDLAQKTLTGVVPQESAELTALSDSEIVTRLCAVRGVGAWTVHMMLMFQLARPDVMPSGDFGVRNGFMLAYGLRSMPHPQALERFGERWAPYRSIASWYMWRAVDLAREKRLPAPPSPPPLVRKPPRRRKAARARKIADKPKALR